MGNRAGMDHVLLVSLRDTLKAGTIAAFNFNDEFDLAGIAAAASECQEPLIAMISATAAAQTSIDFLHHLFKFFEASSATPLFLQLDHSNNLDAIARSLELGIDAVMADFSALPYEQNVQMTASIVELARGADILIEGEVEKIGTDKASLTSLQKLTDFISRTDVDLVAPCLGTVHGFNRCPPRLDRHSIAELSASTSTPLVAHGGDFLTYFDVQDLVEAGVAKINFGPELRVAVHEASLRVGPTIDENCPDHRRLTEAWTANTRSQVSKRLHQIRSARS
jgi:fructose-bisphosphate aldolase, class II